MLGSVGDEATKRMLPQPRVPQGFLLGSQRGGVVEAGMSGSLTGTGSVPDSLISQPGGLVCLASPHLPWGTITLAFRLSVRIKILKCRKPSTVPDSVKRKWKRCQEGGGWRERERKSERVVTSYSKCQALFYASYLN